MTALRRTKPSPDAVLAKAVLRAADQLGLRQADLAAVLGIHRTAVSRLKQNLSLDPGSKQGELALLLVRVARALYALTGGDPDWILHFMHTRSEEHTSELQSLMRNSYAVFCLKKKK